ncbi:MAG TPA: ATP-binding protein [Solirubrobacteraceae bacterium]|nr:ATP-binding protein [Solirubrobacteraceae bacterium]
MSATSSGSNAPAGDAGDRLWWITVAAAALLCVAYPLIPLDRVLVRTLLTVGGDAVAAAAIVVGVRRYRPRLPGVWLLLAGGLACWLVADVIWGFYQAAGDDPFPSWADPFYILGYPLFAAGLLIATRARSLAFDPRTVIDPAIVTLGAGYAAWVFLVRPVVNDSEVEGLGKLLAVIYPVGDLLLVAVAARLILVGHWAALSLRILIGGLALVLAGDVWYALAPDTSLYTLRWADVCLLAGVLAIGLAGLHRSMTALTERQPGMRHDRVAGRVFIVGITAVTVPVVLWIESARGESPPWLGAIITTTLLAALIVVRYAFSATWARRAAERESALHHYAAELLATGEADDLYRVAETSAGELVGDARVAIVPPGEEPAATEETLVLPVEVAGERAATIVVTGDPTDLAVQRDALSSVASQLSLALERQRLLAQEQEAARTLNEQNERLRELDRMKDQLVSSVSHELRSPLTSIVGYMELLLDGEAGDLNDDQRQFLEIMSRNCTRLTKLVDDILFVARVDAGRLSLDMGTVDLAELVAASVQAARPVAEGKDVDLRLDAATELEPLWADPTRISQLLDNLISNAVKFTPNGGTVTVVVAQAGDMAHLEVRDTGVGIPKEELDKLFVRFFRASTSKVAPGTGLGLSIAKSIVEAHRGRIAVESELGEGTTFLVDLPTKAPKHAAPTHEDQSRERLPTK